MRLPRFAIFVTADRYSLSVTPKITQLNLTLQVGLAALKYAAATGVIRTVSNQSRLWIIQILTNGRHLTPLAIFNEQVPPMDMTKESIRQLLGEMEKSGVVTKDEKHAYFLKANMDKPGEITRFNESELLRGIERLCETFRAYRAMPTTSIQRVLKRASENEAIRYRNRKPKR